MYRIRINNAAANNFRGKKNLPTFSFIVLLGIIWCLGFITGHKAPAQNTQARPDTGKAAALIPAGPPSIVNYTKKKKPSVRAIGENTQLSFFCRGPGQYGPRFDFSTVRMKVTAYCPCRICCGRWSDGYTASGHCIQPGDRFCAADKRYPFGTEVIVPGYNDDRPVKVLDRGRVITGNRLDVFFSSHKEARAWGVKWLDVKVRRRKTE